MHCPVSTLSIDQPISLAISIDSSKWTGQIQSINACNIYASENQKYTTNRILPIVGYYLM